MNDILQTTLATVIQSLADFFGTTIEAIMENAPMWLAKYGWFTVMQNIPMVMLISAFVSGIFIFIYYCFRDNKGKFYHIILIIMISFIICESIDIIQCAIAPEIYGLKALLILLRR